MERYLCDLVTRSDLENTADSTSVSMSFAGLVLDAMC
jgi:hypothetical protein